MSEEVARAAGRLPDHLRRGRHERFPYGNLSVDELARWCVAATYEKIRRDWDPFKRRPRHMRPDHLPYHRGQVT